MQDNQKASQKQQENQPGDQEQQKTVTLDAKTYSDLLDRLDELESNNQRQVSQQSDDDYYDDDVDSLYQEGTQTRVQQKEKLPDLDRMSNSELMRYMAETLSREVLTPVMVRQADLELKLEFNEFKESLEPEDRKDLIKRKPELVKLIHKNPQLSWEDAYYLNVKRSPKKESDKEEKGDKSTLRHLPPRPVIHGEKPSGAAFRVTDEEKPKDTREAAARAIEKLGIKFPDQIK